MSRAGILTLCLGLLTLAGAQVSSASAATDLTISVEGEALEVGTPIVTSSSTGLIIRTSAGVVTCAESVMEGTITANGGAKDGMEFTADREASSPSISECTSTLPLGEPTVTPRGLPWSLDLTNKANGKFKGRKSVAFALAFPGVTCVMEGKDATDTFNLPMGEEAVPLELSLFGPKLELAKGSGAGCPTSGSFEAPGIAVSDQAQTSEKSNIAKTKPARKA
jgi:hypothetical protein